MSIKSKLKELLMNPLLDDSGIERGVLDIIYENNKDNTMNLFLAIQQRDRKRQQDELLKYYNAAESGMQTITHLTRMMLEEEDVKKAKLFLEMIFNSEQGLPYIIQIGKAMFPYGDCSGHSNNGKWFFEKLKSHILENKEKYISGDSKSWVDIHNHREFINLIIEKHGK